MRTLWLVYLLGSVSLLHGQGIAGFNYDEAKVGTLPIPDPLVCQDGTRVTTAAEWTRKRRPEVLRLFEREVYGKTPPAPPEGLRFVVLTEDPHALGGAATRREVAVYFNAKGTRHAEILLYLPNKHTRPVPVFVSLSFRGNQSVANDPAIRMPAGWFPDDEPAGDRGRGRVRVERRLPAGVPMPRGGSVVRRRPVRPPGHHQRRAEPCEGEPPGPRQTGRRSCMGSTGRSSHEKDPRRNMTFGQTRRI